MKKYLYIILSVTLSLTACTSQENKKETNTTTALFNGKNLEGWYTYQRRPEPSSQVEGISKDDDGNYTSPIGLNNDPLGVFTVVEEDGQPAIRISGETFGILVTEEEFENYHLKLQFKWGQKKFPPRANEKRDSGILYHSIGKEGAWGGVWMKSLECQVQEGDCGDYISVDTVMVDVPAVYDSLTQQYIHIAAADPMTFSHERAYCHKSEDFENGSGEWNTMEIYTFGASSIHVVNGEVNMRTSNARYLNNGIETPLSKGKIQLQSEGAEIFYREIQLRPISELPETL